MKRDKPIHMDEVNTHQKRLWFDDDGEIKDAKLNITIMT